nr:hypothetical protein [uncultured Cellulosilyticum sp.]
MKYNKIFKPAITVLLVLNLGTVLLLAANRGTETQDVASYIEDEKDNLDAEKKSVLSEDDVDEVTITADTDLGVITEAPIAAKVGKKVIFTVNSTYAGDTMKVRGLNGYGATLESGDYGEYMWTPERAGVFEMVLFDREGNERVTRRINVASENREDIYELTPLEYSVDTQNNVSFNTSIFNIPTGSKENEALPTTQFTIGEAGIWTKTIKEYGTKAEDKNIATTSIVEGKDFLLDRGTYTVTAMLKDLYSVDAEDTKSLTYKKEATDGHKVVIDDIEMVTEKNEQGIVGDHFIVHARCEHDKSKEPEACDLVYAFSVDDTVGTTNIVGKLNGYTESNEITLPNMGWNYTITVKVKHKNNSGTEIQDNRLLLPNAYEAVAEKTVVKGDREYGDIEIKNVKIQSALLDDYYKDENNALLPTQVIAKEDQVGTMYVNSNNYITINVGANEKAEKLQYTAYIIQDGQNISLEPVYTSQDDKIGNSFVYYPKTGGGKSYTKNKSATLSIIVTELNESNVVLRRATKNIEVNIK